jgi:hypothetical protein
MLIAIPDNVIDRNYLNNTDIKRSFNSIYIQNNQYNLNNIYYTINFVGRIVSLLRNIACLGYF